jgi:hypothetical protein
MQILPMRRILPFLFALFLTACNLPAAGLSPTTAPATEAPYQPCAYNWDTQSLPDLSKQVQAAMQAAGMTDITVRAEAYGETCSGGQPSQPPSFGAMETDYRLTVKVASLTDRDKLGSQLEKILIVLDQFPVGTTPGPQSGYVGVSFQTGDDQLNLWFHRADGKSAREQSLKGAALLDQLTNK